MTAERTIVGVVGLGAMGIGMATTLAREGFAVKGFDLSEARRALAAEGGVSPVASLAEVCFDTGFIVFSLPTAKDDAAVVEAHIEALKTAGSRVVIIDTSTSEPDVSRDLAAAVVGLGLCFIVAPFSGVTAGAAFG